MTKHRWNADFFLELYAEIEGEPYLAKVAKPSGLFNLLIENLKI